MTDQRTYSVGQIAKVLHLARSTVVRWIHSGYLKTTKTKGGDNRISRTDVEAFFRKKNIPIELLDNALCKRVLVFEKDEELRKTLERALTDDENIRILYASNQFEAGYIVNEYKPHLIIMDVELRNSLQTNIIEFIHDQPDLAEVQVIGTSFVPLDPEDEFREWGFDAVLLKPVKTSELTAAVKELLPRFRKFFTKEL